MKRYVFFLRHFNDIDNISPVIYFFLIKDSKHLVDVIIYSNDYFFKNDPNLNYLISQFPGRLKITRLSSIENNILNFENTTSSTKNTIKKLLLKIFKDSNGLAYNYFKKLFRACNKITKFIYYKITNKNLNSTDQNIENIIDTILSKKPFPKAVIFDLNRTGQVGSILEILRNKGVNKIICLPVSPLINYNILRTKDEIDIFSERFRKRYDYSGFNALGFVDHFFVDSYNEFFDAINIKSDLKHKTKSLGSIRYCHDWIAIRDKYIQKKTINMGRNKIKIVFFLSRFVTNVNIEEFKRTLSLLSNFNNFEIIIKAHTRSDVEELYLHHDWKNKFVNGSEYDSSDLIDWSDIVIFWSTSVAIEGYLKKKTMVCLNYMSTNKNLYAYFNAGFIADCRDDLFLFLNQYSSDHKLRKYNYSGCEGLINHVVYSGSKSRNIPELYLNFIESNEF